ncbi:MAG: ribonuclease HII [candidate division Zixibacteria bacterium]|nr:ribonuclease HII [candidate division Zixibacteria bacterium]
MAVKQGRLLIAGVDEAGRGPLAGPVVAGAVILNPDIAINGLNDSKLIPDEKREFLYDLILERALGVGVGIVGEKEIDRLNILNATFKAMQIALNQLKQNPDIIYVDGNRTIPELKARQMAIIKGDTRIPEIMAASIIAKVTRDRLMIDYSKKYACYGFERHKGYATPEHYKAIKENGPCPIHRMSFAPFREMFLFGGEEDN